jgi:DNA replication and repair protein RecF
MWLEKLILRNFRSYEYAEISFCKGINMIHGENAQGKTNILEALSLLSTGKSFRSPHSADAIRTGSTFFSIEAFFHKEGVEQTLMIWFDGKTKKISHNHTNYQNFSSLFGILPVILIVPEDVILISGSPSDRRRFIDMHIAQIDPLYVYHLTRYYKAMKHRNALLKQQSTLALSSWEHIMAQAASYLSIARNNHIKDLAQKAINYLKKLSNNIDELEMRYHKSLPYSLEEENLSAIYMQHFEKSRKKEFLLKSTLSGSHRDDILFYINGKEARFFASEGQKRSFVNALHLSARDSFAQSIGSSPLVAIDDFGCHLDSNRSATLLSYSASFSQTILTSPTDVVMKNIGEKRKFIVKKGSIIQEKIPNDENMLALQEKF